MKPTAKQLIECVTWSLDERVAPLIEDKWGNSTLRSVRCLLEHLSIRVEIEGQVLFDDNADLAAASEEVVTALAGASGVLKERRDALMEVGAIVWREPAAYPTVASMTVENDARREALDGVIRSLNNSAALDRGVRTRVLDIADAYLRRRLDRDQPMFAPAFMSSAF